MDAGSYYGGIATDNLLAPEIYFSNTEVLGVLRRSDINRLKTAARLLGRPLVITAGSCGLNNGKPHHSPLGKIDVRTRGLTELERSAQLDALISAGFDKKRSFYHADGTVTPHHHLEGPHPRGPVACDAYPKGRPSLQPLSTTALQQGLNMVKNEQGDIAARELVIFCALGAASAVIGAGIAKGVRSAYRFISNNMKKG